MWITNINFKRPFVEIDNIDFFINKTHRLIIG